MSHMEKLQKLIADGVIPDINDRLDEIFEEIADNKEASEDAKEEIEELREFKADLEDVLADIKEGAMDEEEAKELIQDIEMAQRGSDDEDFGFVEEE